MKASSKKGMFRQKKVFIPLIILALFVAIRIALPPVILTFANNYLADFSPVVTAHIEDIDLSILRASGRAEGITVKLKENGKKIMDLQKAEGSLSWKELFKGDIVARAEAVGANVVFSKQVMNELKKMIPEKKPDEPKKELPFKIERFDLKDSTVTMEDFEGFKGGEFFRITNINSQVTNINASKDFPFTRYNMTASVLGEAPVKVSGKLNLLAKPLEWDVNSTVNSFNLPMANQFLRNKVPLTFKHGTADLFAEAKSEEGVVEGYVKPFMDELDVIRTDENFKGVKHWGVEVITAITNILLKDPGNDSMATRVPFRFGEDIKVDTGEAIGKAIQHGYEARLKRGLENKYDI